MTQLSNAALLRAMLLRAKPEKYTVTLPADAPFHPAAPANDDDAKALLQRVADNASIPTPKKTARVTPQVPALPGMTPLGLAAPKAFAVELLGHTLRVVDAEGSDVELVGDVSIENRAKAEARAAELRLAADLQPAPIKKPRARKLKATSSPVLSERVGTTRAHSNMLDVSGLDLDARRIENKAAHLEPSRGDVGAITPAKAKKLRAGVMKACPCRLCALCLNPPMTFEEAATFGFATIRREHEIMEAQRALAVAHQRKPPDAKSIRDAERELAKAEAVKP